MHYPDGGLISCYIRISAGNVPEMLDAISGDDAETPFESFGEAVAELGGKFTFHTDEGGDLVITTFDMHQGDADVLDLATVLDYAVPGSHVVGVDEDGWAFAEFTDSSGASRDHAMGHALTALLSELFATVPPVPLM